MVSSYLLQSRKKYVNRVLYDLLGCNTNVRTREPEGCFWFAVVTVGPVETEAAPGSPESATKELHTGLSIVVF